MNTLDAARTGRVHTRAAEIARDFYSSAALPPNARDFKPGDPPPARSNKRSAGFVPSSYDPNAHTVELVLSVGSQVQRWYGIEELAIEPIAIDLSRVAQGQVKVLDSHNAYETGAIIGTLQSARFETGQLIGVMQFAQTAFAVEREGMVARGELSGVSIGYDVGEWTLAGVIPATDTAPEVFIWRATKWTLLEVSFVSVPADPAAGVRSAVERPGNPTAGNGTNQENDDMHTRSGAGAQPAANPTAPAPAAASQTPETRTADPAPASAPAPAAPAEAAARFTATDAVDFIEQARALGVDEQARALVAQNERGEVGVAAARSAIMRAAAERQRADTSRVAAGSAARVADEGNAVRDAIVEALFARATGRQPSERAREYMGHRLIEIAIMRTPGVNPRERDSQAILRAAANSTSDFPLILEAAANKILLDRYVTATPTYQAISKRRDLRDFKPTKLLRIGDFPTLTKYQEDGEIKAGTINEGREEVTLGSYGRILRLTRQAIVNDDLNAFDEVFGSIGTTIALFENATFFAMKGTVGPQLADGKAVFHAGHNNLAGAGAAPDVTTLGAARAAIRKQKNLDGNVMNLNPRILFVGADTETIAEQVTASITPRNPDDVNPFSGKLSVVAEGSVAGNAWEVYADPAMAPVWSYGYLADAPGPRVVTDQPFNFDGLAWRVTLDFYAGAIDYRGAYRNPGA